MTYSTRFHGPLSAIALAVFLTACGGASNSNSRPQTITLSGTAAYGAAYPEGSKLTVYNAKGVEVTTTVLNSSTGSYSLSIPADTPGPLVITVSADELPTLVSVTSNEKVETSTVNVTPITNLIAAGLTSSGNPLQLIAEIPTITPQTISEKKAEVVTYLKTIQTTLNDTTDPVSGQFSANGTGHDLLIDALKVQISQTGQVNFSSDLTNSNGAPIAFQAGTQAPANNSIKAETNKVSPDLTRANLPEAGLSVRITELTQKISDCFALPAADRATGSAVENIKDGACKSMFYDSNPALFKHNSYLVGNGTGNATAFKSIFSTDANVQKIRYFAPNLEFTVKNDNTSDATKSMNGDIVFTATWLDSNGNSNVDEFWARPVRDASGQITQLGLIGNLSGLDADVSPRIEFRDYINNSGQGFFNTGYSVYVNSKHPFAKIIVTTPKGNKLTLTKRAGVGFYVLNKAPGVQTNTNVIRLAAQLKTPSTTTSPRSVEPNAFWASAPDGTERDWTESEILSLGSQGTWTFDLYTNASDTAPVNTTKRRTLQRAPTLAETTATHWPTLTDAFATEIKRDSGTNGYYSFATDDSATIDTDANTGAWSVGTTAWRPQEVRIFGIDPSNNNANFDDAVKVAPSTQKAVIQCSDQDGTGTGDQHCSNNLFKAGVQVNSLQLSGRTSGRVKTAYSIIFKK